MDRGMTCCEYCGKEFAKWQNLEAHRLIHTNQRPHACDVCGKRFRRVSNLNVHKLTHEEKRFKCSLCDSAYVSSQRAKEHIAKQHSVKENVDWYIINVDAESPVKLELMKTDAHYEATGDRKCNCPMCRAYCLCALTVTNCGCEYKEDPY